MSAEVVHLFPQQRGLFEESRAEEAPEVAAHRLKLAALAFHRAVSVSPALKRDRRVIGLARDAAMIACMAEDYIH